MPFNLQSDTGSITLEEWVAGIKPLYHHTDVKLNEKKKKQVIFYSNLHNILTASNLTLAALLW